MTNKRDIDNDPRNAFAILFDMEAQTPKSSGTLLPKIRKNLTIEQESGLLLQDAMHYLKRRLTSKVYEWQAVSFGIRMLDRAIAQGLLEDAKTWEDIADILMPPAKGG